ncbi:hypothetical protein [Aquimarina agarivorans]|uniref:hypothetical protein n=1 Tax=Aquimarina agarivorans TaxID=980584 RepID=UPI000248EA30|nr:hypothetical protein [Aquimarina agarivorans]
MYQDFEQIENELKVLKLKRQIAIEELKAVKTVAANNLDPKVWLQPLIATTTRKFGLYYLLKKFL